MYGFCSWQVTKAQRSGSSTSTPAPPLWDDEGDDDVPCPRLDITEAEMPDWLIDEAEEGYYLYLQRLEGAPYLPVHGGGGGSTSTTTTTTTGSPSTTTTSTTTSTTTILKQGAMSGSRTPFPWPPVQRPWRTVTVVEHQNSQGDWVPVAVDCDCGRYDGTGRHCGHAMCALLAAGHNDYNKAWVHLHWRPDDPDADSSVGGASVPHPPTTTASRVQHQLPPAAPPGHQPTKETEEEDHDPWVAHVHEGIGKSYGYGLVECCYRGTTGAMDPKSMVRMDAARELWELIYSTNGEVLVHVVKALKAKSVADGAMCDAVASFVASDSTAGTGSHAEGGEVRVLNAWDIPGKGGGRVSAVKGKRKQQHARFGAATATTTANSKRARDSAATTTTTTTTKRRKKKATVVAPAAHPEAPLPPPLAPPPSRLTASKPHPPPPVPSCPTNLPVYVCQDKENYLPVSSYPPQPPYYHEAYYHHSQGEGASRMYGQDLPPAPPNSNRRLHLPGYNMDRLRAQEPEDRPVYNNLTMMYGRPLIGPMGNRHRPLPVSAVPSEEAFRAPFLSQAYGYQ
jgi:hypothetical protein